MFGSFPASFQSLKLYSFFIFFLSAGDAFLAFWKVGMHDNFAAVIHRAVFCALQIQKNYGMYETEFKTILRGKHD